MEPRRDGSGVPGAAVAVVAALCAADVAEVFEWMEAREGGLLPPLEVTPLTVDGSWG